MRRFLASSATKDNILFVVHSVLKSYSQVFFARNLYFALFLLVVTFFDPYMGMAGLLSVLLANGFALLLGFSRESIREGDFGFNSVLVGLGIGFYFAPNLQFFILLVVGALLSFLFTVIVSGILYKYGLPFLSIPFLIALWSLMLATRNFTTLEISQHGVYTLNELYATGDSGLVSAYRYLKEMAMPEVFRIYFNSLGAILFQFNIISGILIAIGLLIYSRIAFLFSFISFVSAYYFYLILGADINALSYNYIGFNFILSGIALGGYFLTPSKMSILWTVLLVAPLMILTSSLGSIFNDLQLSIYSLPFNIIVLSFLYTLKLRQKAGKPLLVTIQHHSPEKNVYHYLSSKGRFKDFRPIAICPPFFGQWTISQGHAGEYTHKGEWKDAWDFVITDKDGKQFKNDGKQLEDYYCYDKPVIAPADGEVVDIIDDVEDNLVGDANIQQNWGNSIVIKHGYQLYSQISHIKEGSFKVKKGDMVKKGTVLAHCGNSGRSPYPHLHFQIQTTPYIGSKTLRYPLSHYITEKGNMRNYEFFGYPKEGEHLKNIEVNTSLFWAFHFIPGKVLNYDVTDGENNWKESWEVKTDAYNNSYIECLTTGAIAWFINDGTLFYFTDFQGSKKSLLYRFFLSSFRVMLSAEQDLLISDEIPLHLYTASPIRMLHDFVAPIMPVMKAVYQLAYEKNRKNIINETVLLISRTFLKGTAIQTKRYDFKLTIRQYRIDKMEVKSDNYSLKAKCTN